MTLPADPADRSALFWEQVDPGVATAAGRGGDGFLGIPGAIRDVGETFRQTIRDFGLTLVVIIGTAALAGLGSLMIIAGTMALLGFKAGDVARITPPGRAATLAEVAVKG